ncbi:hypothetical protein HRR83_000385 [Exophiala dermatitidis]|uniref:Uncharacterized protein n=2 Tax=Exophiala dermatitidis TaxID=5970 RepID=A0AAN6IY26_EXODE|nr:hypothetical protein HRR75_000349 [Exophiala dermatitidis]KAJ4527632.1 hypothetical protein HRR74_000387 [Exophiala dermatitidis]KAJ4528268.1 hypothetical protein HRR73_000891 [Exophiala dermatitidis]KAJ4531210.1 hypothetical protein HRR76_008883 [Exophiala dermatitidis]KAJ4539048.1 hypothetical protein HRR78_007973 [Exophiala dermatitidis]
MATNTTDDTLKVVCAWPLSGQYGPGSRALYYALIAACVFAQKIVWLRKACVAAALLFPAVAALHGIVLAAVHVDHAVDMDVFGAFQLCSIGILAAPVTVRLSRTYFNDTGRNLIFLWTGLILAGLLSLTVEFFRSNVTDCPRDDFGNVLSPDAGKFQYKSQCGLTCTVDAGPHSPMRGGSANNIYVIPAPDKLTFGTATLLAAACCIPPILSIISMWKEILELNYKRTFPDRNKQEETNELISGTNGATIEKMRQINEKITEFLWAVQIPVIGAAVLAILVTGELNFFSPQILYQTEPIASIGQWAPIAGTALAVLGSLFVLFDKKLDAATAGVNQTITSRQCTCSERGVSPGRFRSPVNSTATEDGQNLHHSLAHIGTNASIDRGKDTTCVTMDQTLERNGNPLQHDAGSRRKVASVLQAVARYVGTAHRRFDDSEFKNGEAQGYPWVPGEPARNSHYGEITRFQSSPMLRGRSRVPPDIGVDCSAAADRAQSPLSPQSPDSLPPFPPLDSDTVPQSGPSRTEPALSDPCASPTGSGPQQRRDTLQVPVTAYHGHTHGDYLATSSSNIPVGQLPPVIVVSPHVNSASVSAKASGSRTP